MSIRRVVSKHINQQSQQRVASAQKIALAIALLSVAAFLASALTMLFSDLVPAGMKVVLRQVRRLRRRLITLPQWGASKTLSKRVVKQLIKRNPEDLGAVLVNTSDKAVPDVTRKPRPQGDLVVNEEGNVSIPDGLSGERAASIRRVASEDKQLLVAFRGFRFRDTGEEGVVKKTKIKIVMRTLKVVVALLTIAATLFSTFSEWEDDPEMVELFSDAKGIASTAVRQGIGGTAQKVQNAKLYRQLRNTSGIGHLLPRGGARLLPRNIK